MNRYAIAFGAGVLIVASVWLFESLRPQQDTAPPTDDATQRQFEEFDRSSADPDGDEPTNSVERTAPGPTRPSTWGPVNQGEGPRIQFVHPLTGEGKPARLVVGAPGMWPPTELWTDDDGVVALPELGASTLHGASVSTWEVLARSLDGTQAFWGSISRDSLSDDGASPPEPVEMSGADDVEVRIVDGEDQPVEGADVRLSRQVLGFVHLSRRTETEGTCTFQTIPGGSVRISGRKPGVGSGSHTLEFDGEGPATVVIRLVEPAGLAMPSGDGYLGPVETEAEPDTGDAGPGGVSTRLYATDEWGGAVDDALIQVWSGDRLVFESRSRGTDPVQAKLQADKEYRVVVLGARYGEGSRRVIGGETREVIVEMDEPHFSISLPEGRVMEVGRIEEILGQPLVEDGSAWLVDVTDPNSPASLAGLQRGDALMSVWRGTTGDWRVLVSRDAELREVVIPAK